MTALPRRSFSLAHYSVLAAASLAAWALARLAAGVAFDLPFLSPESILVPVLLCVAAWSVVEEPALEDGAPAALARLLGGVLLLALGESLLCPVADLKEAWASLGFCGLAAGAALLWPWRGAAPRALAWGGAALLGVLGVFMASKARTVPWDLFAGPAQGNPVCLLFWAALGTVGLALAWGAVDGNGERAASEAPLPKAWEFALLALVLLAAASLRFFKAGALPQGYWYDEVNLARATRELLAPGAGLPLYVNDQVENPGAYLWIGSALFRAFGVRVEVLRIAAGAFGVLAVLPFWALARMWLGRRWALAAALVFGVMHWVLVPQRIAFMSGFALFWMLASFWALWAAHLRGGRSRWFLAGLLLGANVHTYTPARVVPLVVLAFLALQARLDGRWRRSLRHWPALALGFALVAGPMLVWILLHPADYLLRSQQVSIFTDTAASGKALLPELWGTFSKHALMFFFRGDYNARHNISRMPHADFILACGLALAFPWTLGRAVKDARARFLWIWLLAMLAAGVLSMPVEAPQGHRTILAAPALPLAVAWALRDLLAPFGRRFKGGWPVSALAVGVALLASVVALNAWNLFAVWAPSQATFRSFSPRASAVARRVGATEAGTAVFVSNLSGEYQFNGFEWGAFAAFALRQQDRAPMPLTKSQSAPEASDGRPLQKVLLVWGESDTAIADAFKREFPDRTPESVIQPFPGPGEPGVLYLAAELPADSLPWFDPTGPRGTAAPLIYRDARFRRP